MSGQSGVPAGWYPDPSAPATSHRYFDGAAWTEHARAGNLPVVAHQSMVSPYSQPMMVPVGQQPLMWGPVPVSNSSATAAMVLGIICVVVEWGGLLTLACALLAIILGTVGLSKAGTLRGFGKGRATAGLVLGCIGICAYVFWGLLTAGILWFI
jgi:hypothetical protein